MFQTLKRATPWRLHVAYSHRQTLASMATQRGEAKLIDLTQLSDQELDAQEREQLSALLAADRTGRTYLSRLADGAHDQPRAQLSSGHSIPLIGLGTWKSGKGEVAAAVKEAIRSGYRHIDCAAIYGNEAEIGEAFTELFKEGVVKREDLFVTSKLWNTHHAPESVPVALKKTLSDLQLSYLDLYLIHWPSSNPGPTIQPPIIDTWRALESAVDQGLVRSIGVSNFSIVKLQNLLAQARIPPAANQVEAHPVWRNDKLLAFCNQHNVHLTAYSPLGSPDSATIMKRADNLPSPLTHPVVQKAAQKLGKSPAQVLIRWAVQRGTSVLPKSVNPDRIKANFDVVTWALPEETFNEINSLEPQVRLVAGTFLLNEAGPYKTLDDLWDEPTPSL